MRVPICIRLAAVYCAVFCISTALLETGTWFGLKSAINAVVDRDLKARLAGVEEFLEEHVSRKPLSKIQSELASHAALQPDYLVIDDAGGNRIFPAGGVSPFVQAHPTGRTFSFVASGGRVPLRILEARRTVRGQTFNLYLGTDLSVPFEVLQRFRFLLILSAPIVLLCASAAGYWVSKRALKPVSDLTRTARSITTANLNRRLVVPGSGDEVQSLAETLNDMLSRIEEGFRRMAQFTANASHELRTPIALMRTTSEVALLHANATAETYREALHRILRESEKSTDLLDDMLQLARADSASRALKLQPVDPIPGIEQLCEGIEPLAREKELDLRCDGTASCVLVAGDAGYLRRLWLILLDNAIKYTPAGGAIRFTWRMERDNTFICEVQDSGIGIANEEIPRIFERFYRADKARSRHQTGAGLGLAIAHWIVEAHHGCIQVESAPAQGSIFRVILPLLSQGGHDALPAVENSIDVVNQ
ncbi:MAG TPA: ATP-binding protein [Bryobacteraceae bacterium]|nr:ATP-binding protein [Bryobacteraceae bacterium]